MAKHLKFSALALYIATQMNAGKSLEQIRAQRPNPSDEHIAAFMKEMFELMGLAPQATAMAADLVHRGGKRDRDFIQRHCFKLRLVLGGGTALTSNVLDFFMPVTRPGCLSEFHIRYRVRESF